MAVVFEDRTLVEQDQFRDEVRRALAQGEVRGHVYQSRWQQPCAAWYY